jgi:hypothetical protein
MSSSQFTPTLAASSLVTTARLSAELARAIKQGTFSTLMIHMGNSPTTPTGSTTNRDGNKAWQVAALARRRTVASAMVNNNTCQAPLTLADTYSTGYDWGMQQMDAENFRANLEALTRDYGAVQRLADHLGVGRPHMSRVIHGKAFLKMNEAEEVAKYLGFTLREMLLPKEKFDKIAKLSA